MQHEEGICHFRSNLHRDWGAIFSWTGANAEDARGGGVNIIRPTPVPIPPSAAAAKWHRGHHRHSAIGRSIYVNGAHVKCLPPR